MDSVQVPFSQICSPAQSRSLLHGACALASTTHADRANGPAKTHDHRISQQA